jgi:hypothetical protein
MKRSTAATPRPTVDEWGVYDPQQAGLAALFTKLAAAPAAPASEGSADTVSARVLEQPGARRGILLD